MGVKERRVHRYCRTWSFLWQDRKSKSLERLRNLFLLQFIYIYIHIYLHPFIQLELLYILRKKNYCHNNLTYILSWKKKKNDKFSISSDFWNELNVQYNSEQNIWYTHDTQWIYTCMNVYKRENGCRVYCIHEVGSRHGNLLTPR